MTTNNKKQNHIVDNDDPFIGTRRGGEEMNEKPKIVERTMQGVQGGQSPCSDGGRKRMLYPARA